MGTISKIVEDAARHIVMLLADLTFSSGRGLAGKPDALTDIGHLDGPITIGCLKLLDVKPEKT